MKKIRTVIVEDDIKISELHKRFTEKVEGFEVIGIANSLPDGEEMVDVLEPELVLLDLFFPEGNGMQLLKKCVKRENQWT
ncbi:MAG: response regulator [Geovibrio sp.]|nr:response regulator [Geovibrio sp.]